MIHRTAIIVLVGIAFLAGSLSGCSASEEEARAAQAAAEKAAKELEAKLADKAPADKPAAKAPADAPAVAKATPAKPAPKTDCKALEKELMTYSNVHGKVVGYAWGQTLSKAKLKQDKMMAIFTSAQKLQQKLSSDPVLTKKLGDHGLEVLIQAGCGPAGSPAPAEGEARCKKIEENLNAFKTIMGDVLDKGFKDALTENKLGKRIPKLTKTFNQLLPKAREHYKGELQKVNDDLFKRTNCQGG